MIKHILALAAMACAVQAGAVGIGLATAARGHVASQPPAPHVQTSGRAACFWQVPGEMRYVNLAAVTDMYVETGEYLAHKLVIILGVRVVTVKIPKGTEVTAYPDLILQQIEACAKGPSSPASPT